MTPSPLGLKVRAYAHKNGLNAGWEVVAAVHVHHEWQIRGGRAQAAPDPHSKRWVCTLQDPQRNHCTSSAVLEYPDDFVLPGHKTAPQHKFKLKGRSA